MLNYPSRRFFSRGTNVTGKFVFQPPPDDRVDDLPEDLSENCCPAHTHIIKKTHEERITELEQAVRELRKQRS